MKEKIAIIGSGIAGLGCAYFLHKNADLTIYEAGSHIGGHSNTISIDEGGREVALDTGFMVYNEVTYPLLTAIQGVECPYQRHLYVVQRATPRFRSGMERR